MSNIKADDIMRQGTKYLTLGLGVLLLSSVIAVSQVSTPAFSEITPADKVQELIDDIKGMEISKRAQKGLTFPLKIAHEVLTDDTPENDGAACGLLALFVQLVNVYKLTGKLQEEEANDLREAAEDVMNMLDCSSLP